MIHTPRDDDRETVAGMETNRLYFGDCLDVLREDCRTKAST